jgi:hypothetical protein
MLQAHFCPKCTGIEEIDWKASKPRAGIASKSRRLIDGCILLGLGSELRLVIKAMKLTVSRFGIIVPGQLQRSNASTLFLVTLLQSKMGISQDTHALEIGDRSIPAHFFGCTRRTAGVAVN